MNAEESAPSPPPEGVPASPGPADGAAGPPAGTPGPAPKGKLRPALAAAGLAALAFTAAFGGNLLGLRDAILGRPLPPPRPPASSRSAEANPAISSEPTKTPGTVLRSQPWWQSVTTIQGESTMVAPGFSISADALQWRARWTCASGRLVVNVPGRPRPLVDAACPGKGDGIATQTGTKNLQVQAGGSFELKIEQQVDVPLIEAPAPGMSAPGTSVAETGAFYGIDQSGSGKATLYRLASGAYSLRLSDFFVTPNVDLEIKLSALAEPHTTQQFQASDQAKVAPLDVTAGSLNFDVPATVDPKRFRSIVIWCPLINSAYAAATLSPPK